MLIDRSRGLIYDDINNVTWTQDANYAATALNNNSLAYIMSHVPLVGNHRLTRDDFQKVDLFYTGLMTWYGATAWARSLIYSGHVGWQLPTPGQLSSMYRLLGGIEDPPSGAQNQMGNHTVGSVTLINIQLEYWSGVDDSAHSSAYSWGFDGTGSDMRPKSDLCNAWAVHPGDVR